MAHFCGGMTRTGDRCRRKASVNGFCPLHGGQPPNANGRPTKYDQAKHCAIAVKLAEAGLTDFEMASCLGIDVSTLYRWKGEHAEFCEAIKLGKAPADDRVVRSLYHRAIGYSFSAVKIMQDKGRPVIVPHTQHEPPDTAAAFIWLKNRRPEEWRDRRDAPETPPVGDDSDVTITVEIVHATHTHANDTPTG